MGFFSKLINIKILSSRKLQFRHNLILFALNFIFVFIIGVIPFNSFIPEIYSIIVSGIFFAAVISISDRHIRYLYFAVILTVFTWVSTYFNLNFLTHINSIITLVFILYIITISIIRISNSKIVGILEFLRAVNIYFLIGIAGGVIFRSLYIFDPKSIHVIGEDIINTTDFLYMSFETITTLGYGDMLPLSALAKTVAIFLSFSGQLYLAMMIALLMGKYLKESNVIVSNNTSQNKNNLPKQNTNPQ